MKTDNALEFLVKCNIFSSNQKHALFVFLVIVSGIHVYVT